MNQVDILLVEDNEHEAQLTIRSLRKNNLANRLLHINDGSEALVLFSVEINMREMK